MKGPEPGHLSWMLDFVERFIKNWPPIPPRADSGPGQLRQLLGGIIAVPRPPSLVRTTHRGLPLKVKAHGVLTRVWAAAARLARRAGMRTIVVGMGKIHCSREKAAAGGDSVARN